MENKLLNSDCLDFIGDMDDNSVDLAILDPPYNVNAAEWDNIPNHIKMKIQGAVNGEVPQLIKYRFQTMFLKDKLTNAIPNLDSWIMEFVRLDRFRGLSDK